ncbi:hypothetical protein K431DRAFT_289558 [Polychaeton citri CBS 116435]|uniref:Fe2OG dioxygenase domain-containing protein n=1 Tax=Polychaeton citri CBS 116435 TaxID=1314669 RepID=A0A9P4UHY1_9PEZI|nr:hypothetical protein K431DRAFT_289558 [Polychaeton citri CBS 116435]
MYYIPNFITEEEEKSIRHQIPANRWITLSARRLQAHPTTLSPKTSTLVLPTSPSPSSAPASSPLPAWLSAPILPRLAALSLFPASMSPNHCLINEYAPGQGIMAHEDGAAYHPFVATVSLASPIVLEVSGKQPQQQQQQQQRWRVLQEPRSLLLTTGAAYTETLHGISDGVQVDEGLDGAGVANWGLLGDRVVFEREGGRSTRATRVSLTFRRVRRVRHLGGSVLVQGRRT